MAAGQNVPELGGYEFEFTSEVPDDFQCPVCQLTIKDPIQILGCGHRLCKICSESLLRNQSPKCPIDREPLSRDKIFPDAACHRKILDLTVKCSYVGCPWTGELRAVQKHQSDCLFKVVECPNAGCKEKLTRRDMDNHKKRECVWRNDNCEFCKGPVIVKNKQQHHNVCQRFPVQCNNNCGLRNIPREKLVAHICDDCPLTEVHCKYKNLGCQEVFQRAETKSHLESHMESHLNLALCSLEITQNQVRDQSKQIERLTAKSVEQTQQMERVMSTYNDQSQQLNYQSQQLNYQSQQLNYYLQQIDSLMAKDMNQSQQLNDQSQQIARLTSTVQGLVQQMERMKNQDQHQDMQVNKTTNEAMGGPIKKGATNVKVKEGDTVQQGFEPESINDIEVGMKVLFRVGPLTKKFRGTVKYVGRVLVPFGTGEFHLGVELDPDQGLQAWIYSNSIRIPDAEKYFTCSIPGRGVFLKFGDVIECYR